MKYKLGSLFDGSGGFPLSGTLCDIEPMWAAEVEPYPIAVTRSRFPHMKHLGDISKVNGAEIEPVDIITFGSPCQDLSVAGKRAGLKHEANGDDETTRSGLFMEAVRIIKEMRKATNGVYPRFAVWENVPGAFSSNNGEDFRTVLEELIKIVEPSAVMPPVPKNGWSYADSYCGEGWSLAYRVFDAQYWGVPQRRRRIYLVVDFRGERAGEVLFEREGLRGYFAEGRTPWQGTAADAENCIGADDREGENAGRADSGGEIPNAENLCGTRSDGSGWDDRCVSAGCGGGRGRSGVAYGWPLGFRPENVRVYEETAITICNGTRPGFTCGVIEPVGVLASSAVNAEITDGKISPFLMARAGTGGNQLPLVAVGFDMYNQQPTGNVSRTIKTPIGGDDLPVVCYAPNPLFMDAYQHHGWRESYTAGTLTANQNDHIRGDTPLVCEPIPIHDQATRFSGKRGDKEDGKGNGLGVGNPGDPMNTLTGGDRHAVAYCIGNGQLNQITMAEQANTLDCMHDQQAVMLPYQSVIGTLCSTDYKWVQQQQVEQDKLIVEQQNVRYIVRRLTPTECARLQGFADRWAVPDRKDDFTEEEYRFWLDVRNTHAAINGKAVKDYTKVQMLTWYNKLHSDGSEYKLWGNGIAFPNALYVMQGIADVINQ